MTLPTQGTVLESIVGDCDSCEDFIQQSRLIDLRVQEANARQKEQEANRQKLRLEQDPPLLDDPHERQGAIRVKLEKDNEEAE